MMFLRQLLLWPFFFMASVPASGPVSPASSLHPPYFCTTLSLELCWSDLRCSTDIHKTAIDLAQNQLTCCLLINTLCWRSHWSQNSSKGHWHLPETLCSVAGNMLLALKYFVPCGKEQDFQTFQNMGRHSVFFSLVHVKTIICLLHSYKSQKN